MIDVSLVPLLHLCDSLFPTGSYAHSEGLEAAVAESRVGNVHDLDAWLDACLRESVGACDGLAVAHAMRAFADGRWNDLQRIDEEAYALRASASARAAIRSMGRRLLRTWLLIHPEIARTLPASPGRMEATLPVAFAVACASVEVSLRAAVEAFAYTRLASTTSCAMRLLPIGQHEAHARLAAALARVPPLALEIERRARAGERPGAFAPNLDLAAMSHRYVHSRLFLS